MLNSIEIPTILFRSPDKGDVMDEFLTRFSLEFVNKTKSIFKLINSNQNSDSSQFQKQLFHTLSKGIQKYFDLQSFVPTFISIAISNPSRSIEIIVSFFPVILGISSTNDHTKNTLLSFFPQYESNSSLKDVVGCLSELAFSILVIPLLDQLDNASENVIELILRRIFVTRSFLNSNSLGFKLLNFVYESYFSLVTRICQFNFHHFAFYFNRYFQSKKNEPLSVIHFCLASNGIYFQPHNFDLISDSIYQKIPHYLSEFSGDHLVCDYIFNLLCNILPQYKDLNQEFGQALEKKIIPFLNSPIAWASSLRLLGVLNYLHIPHDNKKYEKIIDKKVYRRFKKPRKIDAALDYLITMIRPSRNVVFNWSTQLTDFCSDLYPRLFQEALLDGHEQKASELFQNMAALNLPTFVSTWLP